MDQDFTMATPADFYDSLAPRYHFLFEDWWTAAQRHGEVISAVLSSRGVASGRVLDASCGIGTQALPLAGLGFRVSGTDISREAVSRARAEAAARGLEVELEVCDMRHLGRASLGAFDAVICCDNALPHLLTDRDLARALESFRSCLKPSGWLLVSTRDYDALREARPGGAPLSVHGISGSRHAVGQSWQWSVDGEYVDIELFTLLEDRAGTWRGESASTRYRALQRTTLTGALLEAGFREVEWLAPGATDYFQPIVLAQRPERHASSLRARRERTKNGP